MRWRSRSSPSVTTSSTGRPARQACSTAPCTPAVRSSSHDRGADDRPRGGRTAAVADRRRPGTARASRHAADPDRRICGRVPGDQTAGLRATRRAGVRIRGRRCGVGADGPGTRLAALRVDRHHLRCRARLHGRVAVPPAGAGVRGGLAGTGELPGVVGPAPALREPVRAASAGRGARPGCGSVVARSRGPGGDGSSGSRRATGGRSRSPRSSS